MNFVTSKELRIQTRDILERVRAGERFVITYQGRPVALMLSLDENLSSEFPVRPYEEAWADIERALENTEPAYPDWQSALNESRRRQ